MEDCIFCKIAAGQAPAEVFYQDDDVIAFADISPMAPVHALIVPKKHLASVEEIGADRIIFGSDFPLGHPKMYLGLVDALDISEKERAQILAQNMLGLLGEAA